MTKLSNIQSGASVDATVEATQPASKVRLIDAKTATVTDSTGRVIKVRRLSAIDRMRISRIVGGENSSNDRYVGYATLATSVLEIDGSPVTSLTALQLEATIARLDDDGLIAVAEAIRAVTPSMDNKAVENL